MKRSHWQLLFLLILISDIAAVQTGNKELQFVFKPLIVLVLACYFSYQIKEITSSFRKWIIFALLFSWIGDILLMFQGEKEIFFLLGLSSFLLAHIFYIIFFHCIRLKENIKSNPWMLVAVVLYYASLISWLSPYLGKMKLPVRVYGVVISFMLLLAMHMLYMKNKAAGKWMLAGAALFVLSDSILAINKFYFSFETADIFIMLTYGLAQLFIIEGAVLYIRQENSH